MESNFDAEGFQNCHGKRHKDKPLQFQSLAGGVQKRLQDNLKRRKSSRSSSIDSRRNIPKYDSPVPLSKAQLKIKRERQQLEQWRAEKERKKKEAASKKKKPFTTGMVHHPIGFKPLPCFLVKNASTDTKTYSLKTCVPKSTTVVTETKKPSFAPKDAQFHPPQMIKAKAAQLNLHTKLTETNNTKSENSNLQRTRIGRYVKMPDSYLRNNLTRETENISEKMQNKTVPRKTMPKKFPNRPVPKSGSSSEEKLRSPECSQSQLVAETSVADIIPNKSSHTQTVPQNDQQSNDSAKLPTISEQKIELCQQISPLVTSLRGKARKEMMMKSKEGLLDEVESDIKSVQYFRQQLHSEIQRMTELCDSWEKTAKQNVLPETAQDLLLGAVGQARLLMSSKLQQFGSLLELCVRPELDTARVTLADLHGFWDMVYIQIENVNVRFSELEELRKRGWKQELPGSTAGDPGRTPGRTPRKGRRVKPAAGAQPSRLREIIAAARETKKKAAEAAQSKATTCSERFPAPPQALTVQRGAPFAVLRASPCDVEGVEPPIENINVRFSKLEELRKRGWKKELPGSTAGDPSRTPGRTPRKGRRVKPAAGAQPSRLREILAAGLKAKKEAAEAAQSKASERFPATPQALTMKRGEPFAMLHASLEYCDVEGVEPLPLTPVSHACTDME